MPNSVPSPENFAQYVYDDNQRMEKAKVNVLVQHCLESLARSTYIVSLNGLHSSETIASAMKRFIESGWQVEYVYVGDLPATSARMDFLKFANVSESLYMRGCRAGNWLYRFFLATAFMYGGSLLLQGSLSLCFGIRESWPSLVCYGLISGVLYTTLCYAKDKRRAAASDEINAAAHGLDFSE